MQSSKVNDNTMNVNDAPSPTITKKLANDAHLPTSNVENLTTKPLSSLPTPGTVYSPGDLLHLDFLFYDTISLSGFTSVLEVMYDSTSCP